MSIAFVLGNGTSRKDIPLEPLRSHGAIYGCNALYRSFDSDYLIAVDAKMVLEICQSNYQLKHQVKHQVKQIMTKRRKNRQRIKK